MAVLASLPKACMLDALPNFSRKYGVIASTTSGSTLVVALWSKYTFLNALAPSIIGVHDCSAT
jgi:hypothetical protein